MQFSDQLTLEQQFKMQVWRDEVRKLSQPEAQDYLLEVMRQMMLKDNLIKNLLKP
ncbi:MAG: phycobilisome degradation protein NblA [Coleofasciculaceae cyanobacterium RL_1_1]|jgi:hypothetical protein|nr:phycobilisome degradation protein NblA [Coleofasciculaceae cyanobacterium RL_1_1]